MLRATLPVLVGAVLAGCGSAPELQKTPFPRGDRPAAQHRVDPNQPVLPPANSGRGGYYMDDGPGENPPANLKDVPDAEVKPEPYSKRANRPYAVFGKTYTPILDDRPFSQRGIATWYGRKFHGQKTSSGELYDMYKMTAAHPTLPIPSFARVTSLDSGKSVVVRINDRGPFHSERVIDVSYTAALKLGLLGKGSHMVEVERILPGQPLRAAEAPAEVKTLMVDERAAMPDPAPGYYLQLGAYARAGAAQEALARIRDAGGLSCTFDVAASAKLHRVFCGPFETRQDALDAGAGLPDGLNTRPIVVKR
jgi:rare lipoprotein A